MPPDAIPRIQLSKILKVLTASGSETPASCLADTVVIRFPPELGYLRLSIRLVNPIFGVHCGSFFDEIPPPDGDFSIEKAGYLRATIRLVNPVSGTFPDRVFRPFPAPSGAEAPSRKAGILVPRFPLSTPQPEVF